MLLQVTLSAVFTVASLLASTGTNLMPLWCVALLWLYWALVLSYTLPQYYEVRPEGLFIRRGWRKVLIPYAGLVGIQAVTNRRNGPFTPPTGS